MKKMIYIFIFFATTILFFSTINKAIMSKNTPVWSFEKRTSLTMEQIEAILFNVSEGNFKADELPFILKGKSNCKIIKIDERFAISFEDAHKEYIGVDKANHKLTAQGEWWYKGVYTLQSSDERTSIKLDIYNHAEKYRWVASLMILPEKNKHKVAFEKFIIDLENESKQ
jgi:hypothetical protein